MTMLTAIDQTTQEIAANECGLDRWIETQQPAPCSHLEPITAVLRIGRELISQPMLIRAGLSDDIFRGEVLRRIWRLHGFTAALVEIQQVYCPF